MLSKEKLEQLFEKIVPDFYLEEGEDFSAQLCLPYPVGCYVHVSWQEGYSKDDTEDEEDHDVPGSYYYQETDENSALDEFHACVAISALECFKCDTELDYSVVVKESVSILST